jgi:hypothetical protein
LKNRELVTQREDLRLQSGTGSKTGGYQSEKGDEKRAHRDRTRISRMLKTSAFSDRTEFSVTTTDQNGGTTAMDDKLVHRRSELAPLSAISLTPSQKTLAQQINITAQNAKVEVGEDLVSELASEFTKEPPEAIEWAFRTWRNASPFMPAICDIHNLIQSWHRVKRQLEEEEQRRVEKLATAAARDRGEVVTWPEVLERFAEVSDKTSEEAFEEVAKPIPRAPLDVETWDPQQLRQTKEARKADLASWKERRSK